MTQTPIHPLKIIFMGTPEFAKVILERLYESSHHIIAVFAQPDKPAGRGQKLHSPPVAIYAKEKKLRLFQPRKIKDGEVFSSIQELEPDFLVVAAYGKLLPQNILDVAKIESINVHASLLPKYRGAAPINYALLKGEKITGVSIMRMTQELDAGPVFIKKEIPITMMDNAITLTQKLATLGAETLIQALNEITGPGLKPHLQDSTQCSFAPKLDKDMASIDWSQPSQTIFDQIRALLPWPVAHTTLEGKNLKIFSSLPLEIKSSQNPGTVVHIGKAGLTITTATTDLLIKEVQLEGKKKMNAFDLANGLRLKAGEVKL